MAASLNTKKLHKLLDHDFRYWEVENLIREGAQANKLLEDGFSCLHKIVGISHKSETFILPSVSLMLKYFGDPNHKSVHGLTAVHIAAMWGKAKILKLLMENSGDPYICDSHGKSAFVLARENKEIEVLKLLNEHKLNSNELSECDTSLDEISEKYLTNGILSKNFRMLSICDDSDDPSHCISSSILSENDSNNTEVYCNNHGDGLSAFEKHIASETVASCTLFSESGSSTLNDALLKSCSDISQVESVHQDPETGAELIEKYASSDPTIISVDTSALNSSQTTELYNWRDYKASQNLNKGALSLLPEYSKDLELYLRGSFEFSHMSELEVIFRDEFEFADKSKNWREGIQKSSFNYMLLDPRHTKGLPYRSQQLTELESFKVFISSIFYIGKGKHSRPYSHLYDAMNKAKSKKEVSAKERHILDIWKSDCGVISLHCFQNVIPVEAYTREAMMIDCIGLHNLTNVRKGDYYGQSVSWSEGKKRKLGSYFLIKAMKIFLIEGEKQLFPVNLKS